MAQPFIGQISMMSFGFAPKGWAQCNGQLLPINQNQALFSLLGTSYGGNGQTTFALPNLQGRTPMHFGNGVLIGEVGGEATNTLIQSQMPIHTHLVLGDPATATTATASNNVWAKNEASPYSSSSNQTMVPSAIGLAGGSQPHNNFQPYSVINFVIALAGHLPIAELIEEVDAMASPFVAEIRIFGFNFPPLGWAFCNGQIMPISQNTALFSLLGTTYGGNGTSTFALPNLQASVPLGMGQGPGLSQYDLGEVGGTSNVTLQITEIPSHTHQAACETSGGVDSPGPTAVWGSGGRGKPPAYSTTMNPSAMMAATALTQAGGNQPHNNLSPYLVVTFCIALQGIYPARS